MPRFSVSGDHGNEHAIANEIGRSAGRSSLGCMQKRVGARSYHSGFRSVDEVTIDRHFEFKHDFVARNIDKKIITLCYKIIINK